MWVGTDALGPGAVHDSAGLPTLRSLSMIHTLGADPAAMLAHQGGWDEMLLVAAPIAVIVGLLAIANRRAQRNPPEEPDQLAEPGEPGDADGMHDR